MIRARAAVGPLLWLCFAVIGIWVANSGVARPVLGAASAAFAPVQQLLTTVVQPLGALVRGVLDVGASREENERLRQLVDRLNAEVVRLQESDIENERLRAMLDFRRRNPQFELMAARIIAMDPSSPVRSATIDRGAEAGIREGMVVLSPAGNLVGRVVQVWPTTARVLFIVDSSSSVNALIQRADSRALGIVNGLPGDRLLMRYLPQQEEIRAGDIVVTSGLGENYPRGLHIGQVVEVKRNPVDLFQEARVDPAVKFSRLDSVQVIMNFFPAGLN
ncbi:MAG: rod shape-determining protein MreC [Chloroflexota bacterium]|nr:rod shape-determining protein MreC [Dehalococcoidia bacterium]MDW8252692.1 rod shape-determining protein MreC [Chloroflexota bacterium]